MNSTREKILNESLDLFAEKGYHGTSMREIAKAVGIKGSSIYNHFSGKEEIFSELFNYLAPLNLKSEKFQNKFQKAELDPLGTLNYFGSIVIKEMQNQKKVKLLKMMLKENNNPVVKKRLQNRMGNNIERISVFFGRLQEQGKIESDLDPDFTANEFVGTLIYYRLRFLLFELDDFEELKKATQKHIRFFWKTIRTD
ncbi:TetR family transcriptional regulator [Halanaerobium saccharolyticum]|uniref:TetR family transcriptional regulator n=1 Tax=Halanaerobium saccharolyticum TaxID=43595 RepID=A0A2T5RFF1_9FIRM|nr:MULTISPECIES: TetR/AcrR family transcriptional regulator [Halanaerobium]PTV93069.1 TetR family transcriptional regulator [Halanaerobium saccharolyticum]PUU93869.1 MAG: Regulatory protein, TetR [Halanaerobium sp.]PUU94252.1 MAG: Regulatory protein, TetR [Halanaerobium sp.]TDP89011.1 TetR family transcriptional regulator [Halanaerobium saccharolyticum]